MNKIVIISVDGWEGLYVNGVCKEQGHNFHISILSQYCPIETIKTTYSDGEIRQYAWMYGDFPWTLAECFQIEPELEKELCKN